MVSLIMKTPTPPRGDISLKSTKSRSSSLKREGTPKRILSGDSQSGYESSRRGMPPARQSFIEVNGLRFLITDTPCNDEIPSYVETLRKYNVKHVVRVCESFYDSRLLESEGFKFHDWPFEDGCMPNNAIVAAWLDLVQHVFGGNRPETNPGETIAVHCRAGLGRAPVLVSLALIGNGMETIDAIGFIRAKRRGAINSHQIHALTRFERPPATSPVAKGNVLFGIFGRRRRSATGISELSSY